MPDDTPPAYVPPAYGTFGFLEAPIYKELRRQEFEHRLSTWTVEQFAARGFGPNIIRPSEPRVERDW